MKFHLNNFNDEGVAINDDTKHKEVLSEDDGFGASNSKNIYHSAIHLTLHKTGQAVPFPGSWMDMSVKDLAAKLIPEES